MISLSIMDYMANSDDKDITKIDYITNTIVAKPNSKTKAVLRMKTIVQDLLSEHSPAYVRKRSPTTRNSYERAVLSYYALIVNQANKK